MNFSLSSKPKEAKDHAQFIIYLNIARQNVELDMKNEPKFHVADSRDPGPDER